MAGHSPAEAGHQLTSVPAWDALDSEVVASYAIAYAGYWARMARQPAPDSVPHLRGYQRRAAAAALAWACHRTSEPSDRAAGR